MELSQNKEIWIFLSHSNEDYEKVRRVRNFLEEMNTRPLMFFLKCLNDDEEIDSLIKREIEARTRFILCDSENARKSNWVAKEIEYITKLHKPYDVIDINSTEENIKQLINKYLRKEHLFFSYPNELYAAIDIVAERISKYDFCSSFVVMKDLVGTNFAKIIKNNIDVSLMTGKFIPILSKFSINSKWQNLELKAALEHPYHLDSILPIYLDDISKNYYHELLHDYDCIDLSNSRIIEVDDPNSPDIPSVSINLDAGLKHLGDYIVNAILVKLQGWGNLETYAEHFRFGIGFKKNVSEADKLGNLIVEHWENIHYGRYINGPGPLIRLAYMHKEGKIVSKDMNKAKEYYVDASRTWGIWIPPEYQ